MCEWILKRTDVSSVVLRRSDFFKKFIHYGVKFINLITWKKIILITFMDTARYSISDSLNKFTQTVIIKTIPPATPTYHVIARYCIIQKRRARGLLFHYKKQIIMQELKLDTTASHEHCLICSSVQFSSVQFSLLVLPFTYTTYYTK